jgi:basic amino acid/polyamine antiporter, APA family
MNEKAWDAKLLSVLHHEPRKHTVWSGSGLVVANMVGVGVLISTGFMAQDMGPVPILIAWVMGSVIALCGVSAYSGIAARIGESGGEYRFLSDLVHPFLGYLSGWGSLILGFSAAIAVDAHAIGSFLNTLVPGPDPRLTAAAVVLAVTALHAIHAHWAHHAQNLLVAVKALLLVGFLLLALAFGSHQMPGWSPPRAGNGFPWRALIESQFWIAFAFSGWNAAVYTAKQFRDPARDVGRAMLIGTTAVTILYVLINWVFMANLTPEQAVVVFSYDEKRITLAHLVADKIFGQTGGQIVSVFVILALVSAISAMTMVGPRVYAAMAKDGCLPRMFAERVGPPAGSILLQGCVALILLFSQTLRETVLAASAFLMAFSAMTALAIFRLPRLPTPGPRPPAWQRAAGVVYAVAVTIILSTGLRGSPALWYSVAAVMVLAMIGFGIAWSSARAQANQRVPGS